VLGHDGLVRHIASFIPSKEDEEREARRRRLELQTQSQGGSFQKQVVQLRGENQQLRNQLRQQTELASRQEQERESEVGRLREEIQQLRGKILAS
jgi:hypothetical protein